mgnify:FL=1
MSPDTQIKFNLWAVLGFLVLMGASSFTFLYAEGKETKVKQQDVLQRVVVLETNYANIIKGLDKLTIVVEDAAKKFDKRTENGKRKVKE